MFNWNIKIVFLFYAILDVIFTGMGMGVPIFCIIFGFVVGWYIARRLIQTHKDKQVVLKKIFRYSLTTVLVTFLLMCIIWGRVVPMIFDPSADFENFGHPFLLYDPKISFIGWLVLMIFISPFLQLLTTIFSSYITLMFTNKEEKP
jgi:prolipoprotein diacylglyceryltransferase